jgi:UDPglucose 6-dehydrogenase
MNTISVIGLGKLGASMAAAIADRGFSVIGVDIFEQAVTFINNGKAPVQETNLQEYIDRNRERLSATMSHQEAILKSDISFVIVPTPSDTNGAFSIRFAQEAFKAIGSALKNKDTYHLVVLTSTVLPGSTRYGLLPILEKESGKICGKDFGLCYSPEFIALGSVIKNFLNPDFLLVGEFDERSGSTIESYYTRIMENNPPCKRMSIENAELTKIALNTFVTTKITFANMLADICERIPGGDIDVVTDALGEDTRIGRKYLSGGLGYGGPCFPRDNVALSYFAREIGASTPLGDATDAFNRDIPKRNAEKIMGMLKPKARVAVLGLAYKPFSPVVEESQGLALALALANKGATVFGYDPLAMDSAKQVAHGKIIMMSSIQECLSGVDAIVITTPDPMFAELTADDLKNNKEGIIVYDFWRILNSDIQKSSSVRYIGSGICNDLTNSTKKLEILWRE